MRVHIADEHVRVEDGWSHSLTRVTEQDLSWIGRVGHADKRTNGAGRGPKERDRAAVLDVIPGVYCSPRGPAASVVLAGVSATCRTPAHPPRELAMSPSRADEQNVFCRRGDLGNEASVEQFFVSRLLTRIGYADDQIRPKTSLSELSVSLGRRRVKYKPDYALVIKGKTRWIVEAKAVGEPLDEFLAQCGSYCHQLNAAETGSNPVEYFVITDGIETRLYRWDDTSAPLVTLQFDDFHESNATFRRFIELVEPGAFRRPVAADDAPTLTLTREPIDEVNAAFAWCHQFIHKKDSLSQAAAFQEFVKLVFLKLSSDRKVHDAHPEFATQTSVQVPLGEVDFSIAWIEQREGDHPNPLDALQFQRMLSELEIEIQAKRRQRIFDRGEHLALAPETIKGVVGRLESIDLFGIDEDLNGRLFETFLNATMRGKDLGQFFTSRSVVKLGVALARIQVGRDHTDHVIDACCGTGGFLIDVLADMWRKVDANGSLSDRERETLKEEIATSHIVGVDIARDPPLARIARMNMYLHGDGGSSIFQADALDKRSTVPQLSDVELQSETTELRDLFARQQFDVVLTNPPFAKEYERKEARESAILDEYDVAHAVTARGARQPRSRLRSSVLFFERYHDLLVPGGRLITVIDDGLLGGNSNAWLRDWLRERFLIRAVVSLPGDAFQRSLARVKTSLLILEKKRTSDEQQPPAFMYYTTAVGIDDSPRQRTLPIDRVNRERAKEEIATVSALYDAYLNGSPEAAEWIVAPDKLLGRIDVKGCLPEPGRKVPTWEAAGVELAHLADFVDVLYPLTSEEGGNPEDRITTATTVDLVTMLRVRYDGFGESGDEIEPSNSSYSTLYRVHEGDLVISHINAVHGAVCVVTPELDGHVVTNEYTVCRPKEGVDARLVWLLLRSPEIRADLLLTSTGIGRSRVKWETAAEVQIPVPDEALADSVTDQIRQAEALEAQARSVRVQAQLDLIGALDLDSEEAQRILAAFKPPR